MHKHKIEEARQLRLGGMSYKHIALRLGVSKNLIRYYLSPDAKEKQRIISKAYYKKNKKKIQASNKKRYTLNELHLRYLKVKQRVAQEKLQQSEA